jgi:exonuclease III
MVVDVNKPTNDFSGSKCIKKQHFLHRNRFLNNGVTNPLLIYHQNIRGLRNKIEELFLSFFDNLPHILCFTEHHVFDDEINSLYINPYNLGASYCRANNNYGGVSVFVHENISYSSIGLSNFCHEQDIEICAVKLDLAFATVCILSVYKPPTGNFLLFVSTLDSILGRLFTNSLKIIICGDFNINYIEDSANKLKLDSFFAFYNLHSTVDFSTRITSRSSTAIDKIFN